MYEVTFNDVTMMFPTSSEVRTYLVGLFYTKLMGDVVLDYKEHLWYLFLSEYDGDESDAEREFLNDSEANGDNDSIDYMLRNLFGDVMTNGWIILLTFVPVTMVSQSRLFKNTLIKILFT